MNAPEATRAAASDVRALRRELVEAAEAKIAQIVAMVDALPVRGDADSLIAPLRPRLAQMRVPRPLSFGRLLFLPLQPVLVDGPAWRRGVPAVPRSACQALIGLVRAGLGEDAAALDGRLAGHVMSETAQVMAEGRLLWPRAAAILRTAPPPADWQRATGLAEADYAFVVRTMRLVLSQALWVQQAAQGHAPPPREAVDLAAAFAEVVRDGPGAELVCACLLILFFANAHEPEVRLDLVEGAAEPPVRAVIRRARALAMGQALDRLESGAGLTGTLEQVAGSVSRDAELLESLDAQARQDGERRARVLQVRRALDQQCRARFRTALESDLALPPAAATPLDDGAVEELEQAARALHRFQQSARRIGGREYYDEALRAVTDQLARPQANGLTDIDRVRLTELLLGADRAMTLLRQAG